MKKLLVAILVFLSSCAAMRGYVSYDGNAKCPFLQEQVRCWPVQHNMFSMYIDQNCDLLVMVTNPYNISILADFDTGLYEYRNELIPPHTTRYFIGDPLRRKPYATRSHLLAWRVAP